MAHQRGDQVGKRRQVARCADAALARDQRHRVAVEQRLERVDDQLAHAGMVIVADGTDDTERRLKRVLWNDPATGVMRHADAGYEIAIECAREQGLDLPMVTR
jgi:hypothetical protein